MLKAQGEGENIFFGYDDISNVEISRFTTGEYAAIASSNQSVVVLFFDNCGDTIWTQEFFKGDNFNRLIRAQNKGEFLYIAAALGTNADTAIALLKLDKSGQLIFSKSIYSPENYRWYQFHIDAANDLYFTGNSINSTNNLASIILKLNDQGQEIHAFNYGNSFIWGMSTPALNGGILNSTGRTLFKVDANGALQWTKTYTGFYQSQIPPIALNDGYLVFGAFTGALDRNLVFKIDLAGNLIWSSDVFLNLNYSSATVDSNGIIHISFTRFGNNGPEWGIQKISPIGSNLGSWTLPFSAGDGVYSKDLRLLSNQSMLLAGIIDFTFANYSALALRYLPIDLNILETCKATQRGLQTEQSQISLAANSPNLNPLRFDLFQIDNALFNTTVPNLNENRFCQNNHGNFDFTLGEDTLICANTELVLKADTNASNFRYWWSTGENTAEISVNKEGLYWLEISNPCGSFTFRDSTRVGFYPSSDFQSDFSPKGVLPGQTVTFRAQGDGRFNWYSSEETKHGETVEFTASNALADGLILEFIDSNNCRAYDTLYPEILDAQIFMPNAFSPNGDGLNDVFGIPKNKVAYYRLEVFDRYGQAITSLENESWDGGSFAGGSYLYLLQYKIGLATELRTIKGVVNLIR